MKALIVSVYVFALGVMATLLWLQVLGIARPAVDHWMIPVGTLAFWTTIVVPGALALFIVFGWMWRARRVWRKK